MKSDRCYNLPQSFFDKLFEKEKPILLAASVNEVIRDLGQKDRVSFEELSDTISKHTPSAWFEDVYKGVLQNMVYDECTHVIFKFPSFRGLHRKGASVLDLAK